MRVLICGGRSYNDWERFISAMDEVYRTNTIDLVIHGAATGTDSMADRWAGYARINQMAFPADWKKFSRSAGPKRNQQMLDEGKPDLVVKFPGGKGTEDCVRRAKLAGIAVKVVE